MTLDEKSADELAAHLMISPHAISEAVRRGLLRFEKHRGAACWRFGDTRNGCLRRLDGQPFNINGRRVKAEAQTKGESWHHLIGLDDVLANDRPEILLTPEGSKDALAALHFADAEEGSRITYRVAGEALGAQPRFVERDTQGRVIGAQSGPPGGRCVLDLKQCPETPSGFALQGLDPNLEPLALRERTGLEAARQDIGNITDLISSLVFHDILQQARQIDCHLLEAYASGKRASSASCKASRLLKKSGCARRRATKESLGVKV